MQSCLQITGRRLCQHFDVMLCLNDPAFVTVMPEGPPVERPDIPWHLHQRCQYFDKIPLGVDRSSYHEVLSLSYPEKVHVVWQEIPITGVNILTFYFVGLTGMPMMNFCHCLEAQVKWLGNSPQRCQYLDMIFCWVDRTSDDELLSTSYPEKILVEWCDFLINDGKIFYHPSDTPSVNERTPWPRGDLNTTPDKSARRTRTHISNFNNSRQNKQLTTRYTIQHNDSRNCFRWKAITTLPYHGFNSF